MVTHVGGVGPASIESVAASVAPSLPASAHAEPVIVKAFSRIDEDHVNNFLDCVRSRQRPNGDVLIGHRSAQASHLGNISYMQKRRIDFDPVREEILPF